MSTKTRRPVAMMTPPPQSRSRSIYSEAEKQSLLDNFDLEISDKTRAFKAELEGTLSGFLVRQETEILKIPRDLRGMTLGDLEKKWGGSWAGTVQRIAREKMEEREREEAEAREKVEAEAEELKGKRKRTLDASPVRSAKNARTDDLPGSSKKPLGASQTVNGIKRKTTSKTPRSKPSSVASSSKPPSVGHPLVHPSHRVLNESFPGSAGMSNTDSRRNESFFSANGSPIALDDLLKSKTKSNASGNANSQSLPSSRSGDSSDSQSKANVLSETGIEYDSDDSDDLPDPEALEAKFLAKSTSASASTSTSARIASKKSKRAPSLMFRKSVGHGLLPSAGELEDSGEGQGSNVVLANIPLSDGRTVSFDPLNLSPGRVDAEIDEGGLGESEKQRVKIQVKEEVFKALTAKMEKWKVL